MINRIDGFVEDKNGSKYLTISGTDRNSEILKTYNQVFNGIKYQIRKVNDNGSEYEKDYMKIKLNTDDDIPSGKQLYFLSITVIIRCIFEKYGKWYPETYLDECLHDV